MSFFQCKEFLIEQSCSAMKVGTDAFLLGSMLKADGKKRGLDIGAGTGILSLMLAQRFPDIRIDAIELDEGSFNDCTLNFASSPWSKRLCVTHGDFTKMELFFNYDLIFCNPPFYLSKNVNQDLRTARTKHEDSLPMQALVNGIAGCCATVTDVFLIVPASDQQIWLSAFEGRNFYPVEKTLIYPVEGSQANRAVLQLRTNLSNRNVETKHLVIRGSNKVYTPEYLELTKPFYAKDLTNT